MKAISTLSAVATFAERAARDARLTVSRDTASLDERLDAALTWLERAHDQTGRQGVSYGYSLRGGWWPAYRETSGYVLTTLLSAAKQLSRPHLETRALLIADWLLTVQNDDGSFSNPKYGHEGIVFDTGQVLFGLVAAHKHTGKEGYLDAALRAGEWLADVADADALWTRHEHKNTPHVYNARTAWAMVELHLIQPDDRRIEVARRNLDWAVDNQVPSGFFTNNAFTAGDDPYTHNISYATCGLQESGWLLDEERYVSAARKCSDAVLERMDDEGFISGQISAQGDIGRDYSCLTGQAQLAVVWAKQFDRTGHSPLQEASRRSLRFVLRHQQVRGRRDDTRGAVPGSFPIWGRYAPFSYPNWAAKFTVDACLLQRRWETDDDDAAN